MIGYATVDGKRVAISSKRSTRGREVVSALGFEDFNANASTRRRASSTPRRKIELHVQLVLRRQRQHRDVLERPRADPRTAQRRPGPADDGTGKYEWRGFVKARTAPAGDRPARAGGSSTGTTSPPAAGPPRTTSGPTGRSTASTCSNNAVDRESSTADARRARQRDEQRRDAGPAHRRGAAGRSRRCSTPVRRRARASSRCSTCSSSGAPTASSRLDTRPRRQDRRTRARRSWTQAWNKIADAVMSPVLGPQLGELATLRRRADNNAEQPRARPTAAAGTATSTRTCGRCSGDNGRGHVQDAVLRRWATSPPAATSLWQALKAAGDELQAAQGTNDPSQWRKNAVPERIAFPPAPAAGPEHRCAGPTGPTFQQVISYDSHR